ncbi:MAG: hypothetical protein Kow00128_16000 [Deltaproteobacteria bacterium]
MFIFVVTLYEIIPSVILSSELLSDNILYIFNLSGFSLSMIKFYDINISNKLLLLSFTFIVFLVGSYIALSSLYSKIKHSKNNKYIINDNRLMASLDNSLPILLFLFIAGLVGLYNNDGNKLMQDYHVKALSAYDLSSSGEVSRIFGLGINIFPYAFIILFISIFMKKWKLIIVSLLSMAPMLIELFEGGRRQYFIPVAIILPILTLYSISYQKKKVFTNILVICFVVVFTSLMFYNRMENLNIGDANDGFIVYVIKPIIGELIGCHSITANSLISMDIYDIDFGFRFIPEILNRVFPYMGIGNLLGKYIGVESLLLVKEDIAPWGAFPYLAESYVSFWLFGGMVFGVISGIICFILHKGLIFIFVRRSSFNFFLWVIAISSMFIVKYRSGMVDFIRYAVALTYIHIFIYMTWQIVSRLLHLGKYRINRNLY